MNLEEEAMRKILAEAVVKAIPEAKRDELIKKALGDLLTIRRDGRFGPDTTTLTEAFSNEARIIAQEETRRILREDPRFKAGVEAITRKAVAKIFEKEIEGSIVGVVAETIRRAFENVSLDR